MFMWKRKCPICKHDIRYKNKYRRNWAEKNQLMCQKCSVARWMDVMHHAGSKQKRKKIWVRNCPLCGADVKHTSRSNRDLMQSLGKLCATCGRTKMSNGKRGKHIPHLDAWYEQQRKQGEKTRRRKWRYNCPKCGRKRVYSRKDGFVRASTNGTLCNSCSNIIYKKSWTYVITDEHIKKMAATKAGYETFEAYQSDLDQRKKYYRQVRKLTKQQPIHQLKNYNKLITNRGLNGTNGAYQLDHIIPVSRGYEQGLPPEKVADLTNLQIIPWKDNLLKSNRHLT